VERGGKESDWRGARLKPEEETAEVREAKRGGEKNDEEGGDGGRDEQGEGRRREKKKEIRWME